MRRIGGALLFATALLLTACAAPPPAASPEDAALLADFRRVAYGTAGSASRDEGTLDAGRDHLAKWEIPIAVALIDGEGYETAARDHFAELGRLTGLEIVEVAPEAANMLVFFAEDPFEAARRHRSLYARRIVDPRGFDDLLARMEVSTTCFGLLWGGWPSGRTIDFSVVFIRTGLGARTVQGCLVQETTQVLGLLHDLDPGADSVFSDSGRQVYLTPKDRLILQLLYDPRLKPGMGWAEAEPLARAALRDLKSGG